ncbi:MAG: hypothetical protein V4649_18955 [Bacteroidota bacterium]
MLKKKTIYILGAIGLAANIAIIIFVPQNRVAAAIGLVAITGGLYLASKSDKFA